MFAPLEGLAVNTHAPYLCGHGPRPLLTHSWDEELNRLVQEAQDRWGHTPFTVIGYSLGGRCALGLVDRYPERVTRAIAISAHPGLRTQGERTRRALWEREWIQYLKSEGIVGFQTRWAAMPIFASQRSVPLARRKQQQHLRRANTSEGLCHALRVLGLAAMPRWTLTQREVHHIHGGEDGKYAALASQLKAQVPAVQVHRIDGAGHNPVLESPEELKRCLSTIL